MFNMVINLMTLLRPILCKSLKHIYGYNKVIVSNLFNLSPNAFYLYANVNDLFITILKISIFVSKLMIYS